MTDESISSTQHQQVRQIFDLLPNAIEFSEAGQIVALAAMRAAMIIFKVGHRHIQPMIDAHLQTVRPNSCAASRPRLGLSIVEAMVDS